MLSLGILAARAAVSAAFSLMLVSRHYSSPLVPTRIISASLDSSGNTLGQFGVEAGALDVLLRLIVLNRGPVRVTRKVAHGNPLIH